MPLTLLNKHICQILLQQLFRLYQLLILLNLRIVLYVRSGAWFDLNSLVPLPFICYIG